MGSLTYKVILFSLTENKNTTKYAQNSKETNIHKNSAYSTLLLSSTRICLILKFGFPNFFHRKPNIKQTLIVYVPQWYICCLISSFKKWREDSNRIGLWG